MSRAAVLPVLVALALYGLVGPSWIVAGVLGLLALLPQLFRQRLRATPAAQLVLAVLLVIAAGAFLAATLPRPSGATDQLATPWAALAGANLALCVSRLYLAEPWGGEPCSIAIALVSLAACGELFIEWAYPLAVVAFTISAVLARRYADEAHTPLTSVSRRATLSVAVLSLLVVGVAVAGSLALPPSHRWAVNRVMKGGSPYFATGFSERLWLGSMRGMLQSSKPVLRLRGPQADYLRGIIYTRYDAGRWSRRPQDGMHAIKTPTELRGGEDLNEIELVEREPRRYFLPLKATQVAVPTGVARLDRLAVLAPIAAAAADRIWFRSDGARALPVARPDLGDLQIGDELRRVLHPLARRWTRTASSTPAKLAALERHLQKHYAYSLDFKRSMYREPVLEFLLQSKKGHCEYFASAMTLLARSIDIPARVAVGYRVSERNELGGYFIVRERNAHSWVEAWLPGRGWRSYDPTPPGELGRTMTTKTPFGAALLDLLGSNWSGFLRWLDQRTWLEVLLTPLLLILLGASIRWLGQRRKERRLGREQASGPLPCFAQLSTALQARGIERDDNEPIGSLLARLEQSDLDAPLPAEGSLLLERYRALRYGGKGDEQDLARDISGYVARLQKRQPEART